MAGRTVKNHWFVSVVGGSRSEFVPLMPAPAVENEKASRYARMPEN
jgi:hypothetical protein